MSFSDPGSDLMDLDLGDGEGDEFDDNYDGGYGDYSSKRKDSVASSSGGGGYGDYSYDNPEKEKDGKEEKNLFDTSSEDESDNYYTSSYARKTEYDYTTGTYTTYGDTEKKSAASSRRESSAEGSDQKKEEEPKYSWMNDDDETEDDAYSLSLLAESKLEHPAAPESPLSTRRRSSVAQLEARWGSQNNRRQSKDWGSISGSGLGSSNEAGGAFASSGSPTLSPTHQRKPNSESIYKSDSGVGIPPRPSSGSTRVSFKPQDDTGSNSNSRSVTGGFAFDDHNAEGDGGATTGTTHYYGYTMEKSTNSDSWGAGLDDGGVTGLDLNEFSYKDEGDIYSNAAKTPNAGDNHADFDDFAWGDSPAPRSNSEQPPDEEEAPAEEEEVENSSSAMLGHYYARSGMRHQPAKKEDTQSSKNLKKAASTMGSSANKKRKRRSVVSGVIDPDNLETFDDMNFDEDIPDSPTENTETIFPLKGLAGSDDEGGSPLAKPSTPLYDLDMSNLEDSGDVKAASPIVKNSNFKGTRVGADPNESSKSMSPKTKRPPLAPGAGWGALRGATKATNIFRKQAFCMFKRRDSDVHVLKKAAGPGLFPGGSMLPFHESYYIRFYQHYNVVTKVDKASQAVGLYRTRQQQQLTVDVTTNKMFALLKDNEESIMELLKHEQRGWNAIITVIDSEEAGGFVELEALRFTTRGRRVISRMEEVNRARILMDINHIAVQMWSEPFSRRLIFFEAQDFLADLEDHRDAEHALIVQELARRKRIEDGEGDDDDCGVDVVESGFSNASRGGRGQNMGLTVSTVSQAWSRSGSAGSRLSRNGSARCGAQPPSGSKRSANSSGRTWVSQPSAARTRSLMIESHKKSDATAEGPDLPSMNSTITITESIVTSPLSPLTPKVPNYPQTARLSSREISAMSDQGSSSPPSVEEAVADNRKLISALHRFDTLLCSSGRLFASSRAETLRRQQTANTGMARSLQTRPSGLTAASLGSSQGSSQSGSPLRARSMRLPEVRNRDGGETTGELNSDEQTTGFGTRPKSFLIGDAKPQELERKTTNLLPQSKPSKRRVTSIEFTENTRREGRGGEAERRLTLSAKSSTFAQEKTSPLPSPHGRTAMSTGLDLGGGFSGPAKKPVEAESGTSLPKLRLTRLGFQ